MLTVTIRYHDHAVDITAENVGLGQAGMFTLSTFMLYEGRSLNFDLGFYILHDPDPEQNFGLPTGQYDVPLMIVSKKFNADGSLFDFFTVTGDAFGDVITVNGVPWPFFEVEPRKYRFRLLDASVTRSYLLHLVSEIYVFLDLLQMSWQ